MVCCRNRVGHRVGNYVGLDGFSLDIERLLEDVRALQTQLKRYVVAKLYQRK